MNELFVKITFSTHEETRRDKEQSWGWGFWITRGIITLIAIGIFVIIVVNRQYVLGLVEDMIEFVHQKPVLGSTIIVLSIVLANVLMLPGSMQGLAGGFIFGQAYSNIFTAMALASLTSFVGLQIGSAGALLIGRYVFRELVTALIKKHKIMIAVDKVLQK